MFERHRTFVQHTGAGQFVSGLRGRMDVAGDGSVGGRAHPYLGRVDHHGFAVRKRIGVPWDHFSPVCRGTLHSESGKLRIDYRITRLTHAWVFSWVYVVASLLLLAGVAVVAARDIMGGGEPDSWAPILLFCGLFAAGGLLLMFVLRFARSVADEDSAELDMLIRTAADSSHD